jgi:hypothetical protein
LCDMAYETGRETAIESLRKEHGPDKEFYRRGNRCRG